MRGVGHARELARQGRQLGVAQGAARRIEDGAVQAAAEGAARGAVDDLAEPAVGVEVGIAHVVDHQLAVAIEGRGEVPLEEGRHGEAAQLGRRVEGHHQHLGAFLGAPAQVLRVRADAEEHAQHAQA